MIEHVPAFKSALIDEFYRLYEQYVADDIYGCALVLNQYLMLDHLAISTQRSIFSDQEDSKQYLAEQDKWNVNKWRYRSDVQNSRFNPIKSILVDYFKQKQIFGNPIIEINQNNQRNHLDIVVDSFRQAKYALYDAYGLDVNNMLFFISIPSQPNVEVRSALALNQALDLLDEFVKFKNPQQLEQESNYIPQKIKLTQADKDILIDLAQMVEIQPFNYQDVAQEAYLLTLEPNFIDTNIYIQKLILNIAAMDDQNNAACALEPNEILEQIQQLYPIR
jgi:hypothetical protein